MQKYIIHIINTQLINITLIKYNNNNLYSHPSKFALMNRQNLNMPRLISLVHMIV